MNEWMDRLVDERMDDQQLMIMLMRLMMIIISCYKYPIGTEQCSTLRHSPSASKSNSCILFKKTK